MINIKRSVLATSILMAFGTGAAHAVYTPVVTTTGNNFTMVSSANGLSGGTNDVVFTWDGTLRHSVVADGSYNATLSSTSPFSGSLWTAKNVNLYGAGTYVFDTSCPQGNPSCGTGTATQKYTLTVGAFQLGAHMLFDWGTNTNIDVIQLWSVTNGAPKSWAATGTTSPMKQGSSVGAPATTGTVTTINNATKTVITKTWGLDSAYPGATSVSTLIKATSITTYAQNAGGCSAAASNMTSITLNTGCITNTANTKWSAVSLDTPSDADNYVGSLFIDGPFNGTNSANFNVQGVSVPVPAAAWLLGSGLLGLVGVARRKSAV